MCLLTGACGALDRDASSLTVSPGPEHVVRSGEDFRYTLQYTPPTSGLAAGTELEIIPFAHRRPGAASATLVRQPGRTISLKVRVDDAYSSRSPSEAGSPVRFWVPLAAGMHSGETLRFTYVIDKANVQRAHYTLAGPCSAAFTIRLHHAGGDTESLPSPAWAFATQSPSKMAVILPSQAPVGEELPLIVRVTGSDAPTFAFEGTITVDPMEHVTVLPGRVSQLRTKDAGVRLLRVRFDEPGLYRLSATAAGGLTALSNPIRVGQEHPPIYWGTVHWHSHYSWDSRNFQPTCMNAAEALKYARDVSLLDFMAVTDHGQHDDGDAYSADDPRAPQVDMPREDWDAYQDEVLNLDATVNVLPFFGYEHRDPRGDTNIIFRNRGSYFIEDGKRLFVEDVWHRANPGDLLTIPHLHPRSHIGRFSATSIHERLVEIRSWHGAYEFYLNPQPFPSYGPVEKKHGERGERVFVQDLLAHGRRLGFVGSDDHGDLPANAGVTAVYAPERTRDAIFDTLLSRRVYATTGARMLVDFRMGELVMGDEQQVAADSPLAQRRTLSFTVRGTSAVKKVTIIRNNQTWREFAFDTADVSAEADDTDPLQDIALPREVGGARTAYYYLRVVQDDGATAWSSPIFLLVD